MRARRKLISSLVETPIDTIGDGTGHAHTRLVLESHTCVLCARSILRKVEGRSRRFVKGRYGKFHTPSDILGMYTLRYVAALLPLVLLPCSAHAQNRAAEARPRAGAAAVSEGHRAASLISAYRATHGLRAVRVDPHLIRPADHQARAVAQLGWLSHGDFAGRMASFGIRGKAAENLSAGLDSVDQVIAQWQASSGHNANLLMPDFGRVGLARASSDRTYWVLVLAR